jgi:hypothetical protein
LHAAEDEQGYAAAAVGSADSGSATDAGARGDRGADGCDWISAAPGSRGRRLDRSPQRAWATPLEVLLVAERAALLAGRDDEFTMLVTIGYTGMRWGETIGLERDLLLPALINVEWQLREIGGRFHRLPPKDDSYRSTRYEPLVPVDLPAFFAELLTAQAGKRPGQRCSCAAEHGGLTREEVHRYRDQARRGDRRAMPGPSGPARASTYAMIRRSVCSLPPSASPPVRYHQDPSTGDFFPAESTFAERVPRPRRG